MSNESRDIDGLHVLLVDGQPYIRTLVQGMLQRVGAKKITHASNSVEAIHALNEHGNGIKCITSYGCVHKLISDSRTSNPVGAASGSRFDSR